MFCLSRDGRTDLIYADICFLPLPIRKSLPALGSPRITPSPSYTDRDEDKGESRSSALPTPYPLFAIVALLLLLPPPPQSTTHVSHRPFHAVWLMATKNPTYCGPVHFIKSRCRNPLVNTRTAMKIRLSPHTFHHVQNYAALKHPELLVDT